jgi:hypothetical protein
MYSAEDDNFSKMYYNQKYKARNNVARKDVLVKWVGDTSKVEVKTPEPSVGAGPGGNPYGAT